MIAPWALADSVASCEALLGRVGRDHVDDRTEHLAHVGSRSAASTLTITGLRTTASGKVGLHDGP